MKLETKLGISTGVLVLAMFLSALTTHVRLTGILRLASDEDGERQPFILTLQTLRGHLADSIVALEDSLLAGPQASPLASPANPASEAKNAIDSDLALLRDRASRLDLGPDANRFRELAQELEQIERAEHHAAELNAAHSPDAQAQAQALLREQVLPLNSLARQTITRAIHTQSDIVNQEIATLQQSDRAVVITLWATTTLGALVGSLLLYLLARRFTRSIDLVSHRADAIAAGDLTGSGLPVDSADQIGSLALAMQQMQASLSTVIGAVAHTAGDLTASAVSMRSASDQVHRRVDQQTQQTQQAATAMQEMSASIAEVSRHTHSAAQTARSAAQTANEGGVIVKRMLDSMRSIAAACSDASSTVSLLGEDSRRVSQVVTVIDEIARKTNLLALNAAIEAARAGEQGRGFAVVAGEVRHLAESTAQATGEISAMIQGIQDRTHTAIASMAAGNITVEQGFATTNQAGDALERIIGMAERVERMITQIAIAASQQAAAADQSSSSLDSIHTLSNENLAEMATTTAGIESLRVTAANLERQVERFRLHPIPASTRASARPILLKPIPA